MVKKTTASNGINNRAAITASQGLLEESFEKISNTAIAAHISITIGIIMNILGIIVIIVLLDKAFEAKSFVFGGQARPAL